MKSTVLLVAACLLATGLAGCIGNDEAPGTPEAGDPSDTTPIPEVIELEECSEHFGTYPIPATEARPYLPDGFQPVGLDGEELPEGIATVAVFGLGCQRPGAQAPITQFFAVLPVDPPPAYQNASIDLHNVLVNGVTNDPEALMAYRAWGLPRMTGGELQFDTSSPTPGIINGQAQATNDNGSAHLTTTVAGPAEDVLPGIARFYGVEDRELVGIVDFAYTDFDAHAGQAHLENNGLIPLPVEGPGAGVSGLDASGNFQPVELGPDPGAAGEKDLRLGFTLHDCTEQFAYFTIPASQAEPYLPDGFEPVTLEGVPLHEGTASLILQTLACPGSNGTAELLQTRVSLGVDPPEAYELESAAYHFVHVAGITQAPSMTATMEGWGIPRLFPGEVVLHAEPLTSLASRQESTAHHEDVGLTLTTTVAVPVDAGASSYRLFGVEQGEVTGIVDITSHMELEVIGEALVENDGLIPFDINGPGVGAFATDLDYTYTPVALPGSEADAGLGDQEGST